MKKFIKNHLAVILSFAIVLTTILPVLGGLFVSANEAEIAAAVETLKTEWVKLGQSVDSTLIVNRYFVNGTNTGNVGKGSSTFTGTLGDGVDLGTTYGEITLTDAAINISGRSQQLFLEANSINTTGNIEDIIFWVKPTFAGTSDISFNVTVTYSGQNTYENPVVIPASKDGQWIKISLDEVQGGDWKAALSSAATRVVARLELTFTGNNGDKILVGSAHEVTARTLPAGSENWSAEEWVAAAKAVTGIVNDATAFNSAIIALEAALASQSPQELALTELKNAWKNLGTQVDGIGVGRYFGAAGTNTGTIGQVANTFAETLPAGVDLGRYFGQITLEGAGDMNSNKQLVLFEQNGFTNTVGGIEDIRFFVKPTFAGTTDITIKASVNFSNRNLMAGEFVIPASKNGQWVEVSFDAMNNGNWKSAFGAVSGNKPGRLDVVFSGSNGDSLIIGSALEVVTEGRNLPDGSNNWSNAEWITNAKALDLTDATNVGAFKEAIANFESLLGDNLQKEIALTELKEAWKSLGDKVDGLGIGRYFGAAGTSTGHINKTPNTYTEELPAGVDLGKFWGEITLEGAGEFTSSVSKQVLLFENGGATNTVRNTEDIRFFVKPTFAGTTDITVKAAIVFSSRTMLSGTFTIPASKNGQWVEVSFDAMNNGDWKSALSSALDRSPARLDVSFSGTAGDKLVVGSALEVVAERALPTGSEDWTVDEWIVAASELNLAGALNVDVFNAALGEISKFASGSVEEIKAIAEFKKAWANLGEAETNKLMPKRYFVDANNSSDVSKPIASLGEAVDETVNLGKKYARFTLSGEGAMSSNTQLLLFEDGSPTANTIGDIENIVLWVKPTFAGTKDMTVSFRICYPYGGGSMAYTNTYTIPASDSGKWIKLDLNEITGGYKSALSVIYDKPISRFDVCFSGNEGDIVTTGSILAYTKKALPAGSDAWGVDKWINAAEALDLSTGVNIAEFQEAVTKLYAHASISREEKIAIKQLKAAWAKMGTMESTYRIPNRWFSAGSADATYKYSRVGVGTAPEGVTLGSIYGSVTLDGTGDLNGSKQMMLYEYVNGETAKKPTNMVEDIAVWVKLDFPAGATEDATVQWRLLHSTGLRGLHDVTIPASKSGEWVKLSVTEAEGAGWNAAYPDTSVPGRLDAAFIAPAGTVLTTGSAYTISSVSDTVPSAEDSIDWNVADWLHACAHINPETHTNSEDFVAARAYAEDVRDRLLIARSCEKQDFATLEDAENGIDENLITHSNLLEGIVPDVSVFDGTTATPVTENETIGNITDTDATTSVTIDGLAGNKDTFVDFAFDSQGMASVNQMLVLNDGAALADKYYIYVGNSRSELFLAKNLVAAHTLVDGGAVQFFNFTANAIPEGKFIGLRVYSDDASLSIPEVVAYGPVSIYSVDKEKLDNVKVAALGKNLLKGIEPRFRTTTSQKHTWTMFKNQFSAASKIESLTDGDVGTGVGYYQQLVESADDKTTLHIFYDLGDTYTIEKLHLQHIDLPGYQTGEYEIYASPDLASLFSQKSKIITYDNRVNGPNGTSTSQVLTLNKQINARYISFCIKFPVSDYERLASGPNQGIGIRLMELGVYGPRYEKPYALVNLAARTALDVTRIAANGKATKLNDTEYDGIEHKLTYDGKDDTFASVNMAEGESLEFFYDLAADQVINKLQFKTNAGTIKQMKVYASDTLENMYKNTSLVFNYNADVNDMGNDVFVDFTESPKNIRYVRFVIEEIDGTVLEPVEIGIIGGNDQEFFYNNLAEGKSDTASFFTASSIGTTIISEHINKWKFGHTTWSVMYHSGNAVDNDPDTVFDFYGGKNGEESLNMLIDMGTLSSIDNITILGGSSEQYWPDEVNFYFGTNDLDVASEKAVPAKKWTTKAADGTFSYDFVPQIAQYVRVEIVRSDDTIYSKEEYGNKIATVLAEIQVNGLEARGRVVGGVVASFTDEETGITVDIGALRDNDVYTTVQDILVIKRKPTEAEVADALNANGMNILSDAYEVYLLDLNGNVVTDFGGRTVTYKIPQNLISQTEDIYVLHGGWGGFNMVEFETVGGNYCATFEDATFSTFALGAYAEIAEEPDAPTTDVDKPVEDNGDDEYPEDVTENESEDTESEEDSEEAEEEEEDEEEETKKKKKKKIKVVRKPDSNDFDYLWIIIAAAAVVIVAAGATLFIILAKKKKKQDEEE